MLFIKFFLCLLFFSFFVNADQNDSRLDELFVRLSVSKSEEDINKIVSNIWEIWLETNDPMIAADFSRGLKSMSNGDLKKSIAFFTKVIKKNPNFAEAWNKRATVYYMIGDFDSSMTDINETLKLEPRHFGAMDGMSLIFININEFKKAIHVYDQMLNIFPKNISIIKKRDYILNKISKST